MDYRKRASELQSFIRRLQTLIRRGEDLVSRRERDIREAEQRQRARQMRSIVGIVSKRLRVSPAKIYSRDRHAQIALARQVCMAIARADLKIYREHVGTFFRRCPSQVFAAEKAIRNHAATETRFAVTLAAVRADVQARIGVSLSPLISGASDSLSPRVQYAQA